MKSKVVEEQLKQCTYADLSNFDPKTNTYRIPKYSKPQFSVGKCYLVKLSKEVIGNRTSVLAVNWNNGSAPNNEYYKAYINKALGKNVYADCLAYDFENGRDLSEIWSGWLNVDSLTQLAVLQ